MFDASNSPLQFPCAFPIKAFGRGDQDVAAVVLTILQRHVIDLSAVTWQSRPSGGGKWQAVTAVIPATSRAQLDAIYTDLSAHECIVYTL